MQWNLLLVAAGLYLVADSAAAITSVRASELRADCQAYRTAPDSTAAKRCLAYIHGFLDGAIVTDARVAQNVSAEYEKSETYSQRVIRTRVRERNKVTPTYYAGFCVGNPVQITVVVDKVIAHLEANPPGSETSAAALVYAALKSGFPCKPSAR